MTSFVYLRNVATSDIPISGFPGCENANKIILICRNFLFLSLQRFRLGTECQHEDVRILFGGF